MTLPNSPNEIVCPHCRQTYAIAPEQWPQYQGQSIACTKCGKTFVVGGSAPGAMPPPLPPMPPIMPGYAQPGYGYPPPRSGLSGGAIAGIIIGVLALLAIPCLIAILLPALNKVRQEALKAKCSANMRMLGAAMITYSNTHNGEYPDSMVTLIRSGNATPMILVCPDSTDTPLNKMLGTVTQADLPGHCSYIYVAGGMNSMTAGGSNVLLYESTADHHSRGINVLYGDMHVAWLPAIQAQQMIQNLPTSAPTPTPAPIGTNGSDSSQ